MAKLLEDISRERSTGSYCGGGGGEVGEIGADPELDEFMDSYCRVLVRYKYELSKPFDEAVSFLANTESQLSNLCKFFSPQPLRPPPLHPPWPPPAPVMSPSVNI